MMQKSRIKEIIERMGYEELLELQKKLNSGEFEYEVKDLVERKKHLEQSKVCPVCNSKITEGSLTLFFGPPDFRKRASFCALDCLEYFINQIKTSRREE